MFRPYKPSTSLFPALLVLMSCSSDTPAVNATQVVKEPAAEKKSLCDTAFLIHAENARRIEAFLNRSGEFDRAIEDRRRFREIIRAMAVETKSDMAKTTSEKLDALFSTETLRKDIVCRFTVLNSEMISELESWMLHPDTLRINAAIWSYDPSKAPPLAQPESSRRKILARITQAMHLQTRLLTEQDSVEFMMASAIDAFDPTSSSTLNFRMNRTRPIPPEVDRIVDAWVAPALQEFDDQSLSEFTERVERPGAQRFFSTRSVLSSHQVGEWHADVISSLEPARSTAAGATSPAGTGTTTSKKAVDEARRLLRDVGTRVVMDEARTLLLQAEPSDPKNAEIKALLGEIALHTRSRPPVPDGEIRIDEHPDGFQEAERYLQAAIALDPKNAGALMLLGRLNFLRKEDDAAELNYKKALAIEPDHADSHQYTGDMAFVRGDLDNAIARYTEGLSKPERVRFTHFRLLSRLHTAYDKRKTPGEFSRLAKDYLDSHPDLWDLRFIYAAHLLESTGNSDAAILALDPVPDQWLPQRKQNLLSLALILRAGDKGMRGKQLTAAGRQDAEKAIELAVTANRLIGWVCSHPDSTRSLDIIVQVASNKDDALHEAMSCSLFRKNNVMVGKMLKAGAAPNARLEKFSNETPLCAALYFDNPEAFELLLSFGADPKIRCADGRSIDELMTNWSSDTKPRFQASLARHRPKNSQ